jgi:hypothetical protein
MFQNPHTTDRAVVPASTEPYGARTTLSEEDHQEQVRLCEERRRLIQQHLDAILEIQRTPRKNARKRLKPITAQELHDELELDEEFQARKREIEGHREVISRVYREDELGLIAELREAGLRLEKVSDLVPRREDYSVAFPILMRHLSQPHLDNIRDMIARSLAVPHASAFNEALVREYRRQAAIDELSGKKSSCIQGLAVAVALTTPQHRLSDLFPLLRDESLGSSRSLLLIPLKKSREKAIVKGLREFRGVSFASGSSERQEVG